MNLKELLLDHKQKFREKLIEAVAKKNTLTKEQVIDEHSDFIKEYISEKYRSVDEVIDRMINSEKPILLNIRRDRSREDKCKLCEGNQANVDEITGKYGENIEVIEVSEDKPEGGALYNIIFHEEAKEKKLPLTAVINKGKILKFWAGKSVEPSVYEIYLKRI
ncbi:MAG: hypothetical protein J5U16_00855 [Candidatus Methanoperedens sp.]|nr:hypothetical protein [Candidatus Methanoperedens sp.]